jgi:hypothetical protein
MVKLIPRPANASPVLADAIGYHPRGQWVPDAKSRTFPGDFRLGRRRNPEYGEAMDSADALRRWLGLFCLTVAAGMLIWGQTLLKPYLEGVGFLIYWSFCFLFTFGAILIALLDVRAMRRRTRREQQELLQRTLDELENERSDT